MIPSPHLIAIGFVVAGLALGGAYLQGRSDGGAACEARYAAATIVAQRNIHRIAERLASEQSARVEAETAARAQRLSAARSVAPSCDVPPGAVETMRGLMEK